MHYLADAMANTAFRQMLRCLNDDKSMLISFMNAFIPAFGDDLVSVVEEMPRASPTVTEGGEIQTFLYLHAVSNGGAHYVVEIQTLEHVVLDQVALFYACSVFSRQLSDNELCDKWNHDIKSVITLQIIKYDHDETSLTSPVHAAPLTENLFMKNFMLTSRSNEVIEDIQIVQVELPKANRIKKLFPPRIDFTRIEWWLSILLYAQNYTVETIDDMHSNNTIPETIYKALLRLDVQKWDQESVRQYEYETAHRSRRKRKVEKIEDRTEVETDTINNMILRMADLKIPIDKIAIISQKSIQEVLTIIESSNTLIPTLDNVRK